MPTRDIIAAGIQVSRPPVCWSVIALISQARPQIA
jgi:hypothetical protein